MGEKQTKELRRKVLAFYPARSKLKHLRSGGYNNQKTYCTIVSEMGNILSEFSGFDLESALREKLNTM